MKLIGIILKVVAAVIVMSLMGFKGNSIFGCIIFFSMIYGLVTYYVWYFKGHHFSFSGGSILSMIFSVGISLVLPLLFILIPYIALNALLPGEIGMYIGGIILLLLCLGCLVCDVIKVIRIFNPSFLEGLEDKIKKIFKKDE